MTDRKALELIHEGDRWEAAYSDGTSDAGRGDVLEAARVAEVVGLRLDRVLEGGCRTFWTTGRPLRLSIHDLRQRRRHQPTTGAP